jgi:hypothetical protein
VQHRKRDGQAMTVGVLVVTASSPWKPWKLKSPCTLDGSCRLVCAHAGDTHIFHIYLQRYNPHPFSMLHFTVVPESHQK